MFPRIFTIRARDRGQRVAARPAHSGRLEGARQIAGALDGKAATEIIDAVDVGVKRRRADAQMVGQPRQRELGNPPASAREAAASTTAFGIESGPRHQPIACWERAIALSIAAAGARNAGP